MKSITLEQIKVLADYIQKNHSPFFESTGTPIKYMDIGFDFRTNTIFTVNLRGYWIQKRFHVGDDIHIKDGKPVAEGKAMIDEIYSWLKEISKKETPA